MRELKPYLAVLGRRRRRLLLGALLMLATVLSAVGLLALSGWFITATAVTAALWAAGTRVMLDVYVPGAGIRSFALARTLFRYLERLFNHDTVLRLLADLRGGMFAALTRLDPTTLSRFRAAVLLNRLTADIDTLDNLYLRLLAPPLVALASSLAVAALVAMFLPGAGLAAGAWLLLGWLLLTLGAAIRGAAASGRRVRLLEGLRVRLIEQVQGLAELLAYGSLGVHRARIDALESRLLAVQRQQARRAALGSAIATLTVQGGMVMLLVLAVAGFAEERISAAVAVLLPLAVLGLGESFSALAPAFLDLGATREAARRLNAQGRLRSALQPPAEPAIPTGTAIRLDQVSFAYPRAEVPVLDSVSLQIAPGEHVALTGASGSGKSTVANLLARLVDPGGGRVLIGDVTAAEIAPTTLRERVAYLTQATELFNDTIAGNLRIAAPRASDEQLMAALRVAALAPLVQSLPEGLQTWLGESGRTLSGGEARRLALARVVLRDTPIVLLDEPFAGLDAATAAVVARNLEDWSRGRTALIMVHDADTLPAVDRALHIAGARVDRIR
jgi:ATP-binding cassette subfamily C protein CydC